MGFRLSLLRQATEFSLTSKVFASSAAGKLSGGSAGALHLLGSGNSCDQGTPAGGEPNRSGRQVAAVGGAGATLPWMMSQKPFNTPMRNARKRNQWTKESGPTGQVQI